MAETASTIAERLRALRVVPVIAIDKADDIVPVCEALGAGGLPVAEITFRTPAGRAALKIARDRFPDFLIGAGTVTLAEEVQLAADAGAHFAVAPGTSPAIVARAGELGLPFFPGVCTPTDIELALSLGARLLKFFPAEAAGGLPMVAALHAPYKHRGVSFMPTGGIKPENLASYLASPAIAAVGGTWIVTADLVKERRFDRIQTLAGDARAIAAAAPDT